jgi:hypothetical protein
MAKSTKVKYDDSDDDCDSDDCGVKMKRKNLRRSSWTCWRMPTYVLR